MLEQARSELAPTGILRAAINLSNFLLVSGYSPEGDPQGVSPDMARAVADRLGVGLELVPFATSGELADAATEDLWDIGNIGGQFTAVQQAIGTKPDRPVAAAFLRDFV